jgi:hypothetical protein
MLQDFEWQQERGLNFLNLVYVEPKVLMEGFLHPNMLI